MRSFIVSSLLLVGCDAALYIGAGSDRFEQPRNPYYYLLSYFGIHQLITALTSPEFWRMQKMMILMNTQVFGVNGGEDW
jgi:hypothetical protein